MKFLILTLCLLLPFALTYLIKEVELSIYVITLIIILFTIFIISYLNKYNKYAQFSLKSLLFKTKNKN